MFVYAFCWLRHVELVNYQSPFLCDAFLLFPTSRHWHPFSRLLNHFECFVRIDVSSCRVSLRRCVWCSVPKAFGHVPSNCNFLHILWVQFCNATPMHVPHVSWYPKYHFHITRNTFIWKCERHFAPWEANALQKQFTCSIIRKPITPTSSNIPHRGAKPSSYKPTYPKL